MSIKEILAYMMNMHFDQLFNHETSIEIKRRKLTLTKSDKRYLQKKLSEFHNCDVKFIFCVILAYSIWSPDESIVEARKKGVFRYRAWGYKSNNALFLLQQIQKCYKCISYSNITKNFIERKIEVSWMFDFYKKSEEDLLIYIKRHHRNRKVSRIGDRFIEEALFKELLVFADLMFYSNNHTSGFVNKNNLEGYSHEEICESISYIIYLYDKSIGIKHDHSYNVSASYVLSDEIKK